MGLKRSVAVLASTCVAGATVGLSTSAASHLSDDRVRVISFAPLWRHHQGRWEQSQPLGGCPEVWNADQGQRFALQ